MASTDASLPGAGEQKPVASAHDLRTIASLTSFPYTALQLNNLADALDALETAVKGTGLEPGGCYATVSVQLGDRFVSTPLLDPDAVKRIQRAIHSLLGAPHER